MLVEQLSAVVAQVVHNVQPARLFTPRAKRLAPHVVYLHGAVHTDVESHPAHHDGQVTVLVPVQERLVPSARRLEHIAPNQQAKAGQHLRQMPVAPPPPVPLRLLYAHHAVAHRPHRGPVLFLRRVEQTEQPGGVALFGVGVVVHEQKPRCRALFREVVVAFGEPHVGVAAEPPVTHMGIPRPGNPAARIHLEPPHHLRRRVRASVVQHPQTVRDVFGGRCEVGQEVGAKVRLVPAQHAYINLWRRQLHHGPPVRHPPFSD